MKEKYSELKAQIKLNMEEGAEKRQKVAHLKEGCRGDDAHDVNMYWRWDRKDRRVTHLAYCYLKGRTYKQCEQKTRELPAWSQRCQDNETISAMLKLIIDGLDTPYSPSMDKIKERDTEKERIKSWIKLGNVTRKALLGETVDKEQMLNACVAHHEDRAEIARKELAEAEKSAAALREKLATA
jgi:hypothetical protein